MKFTRKKINQKSKSSEPRPAGSPDGQVPGIVGVSVGPGCSLELEGSLSQNPHFQSLEYYRHVSGPAGASKTSGGSLEQTGSPRYSDVKAKVDTGLHRPYPLHSPKKRPSPPENHPLNLSDIKPKVITRFSEEEEYLLDFQSHLKIPHHTTHHSYQRLHEDKDDRQNAQKSSNPQPYERKNVLKRFDGKLLNWKPKLQSTSLTAPRVTVIHRIKIFFLSLQGKKPPRGGHPHPPPPIYDPGKEIIKATKHASKLMSAKIIRIEPYPEPLSEVLLTSHYLGPKNYKIFADEEVIYYSYDYTAYISHVDRYVQTFSQLILDKDDIVVCYQECFKYPNCFDGVHALLDCHKPKFIRYPLEYNLHSPKGVFQGKVLKYGCWWLPLHCDRRRFCIFNKADQLIYKVKLRCQSLCKTCAGITSYSVLSVKTKQVCAIIRRQYFQSDEMVLFPSSYKYSIKFHSLPSTLNEYFLLIGCVFFLDFLKDSKYRGFIRFGATETPLMRYK